MTKKKEVFDYTIPQLEKMVRKALNVDDSSGYALDQEIKTQSKNHSEWAFLTAKARKLLRIKELELQQKTAEIVSEIRRDAADEGKPLPKTAPIIKEMVPLDVRWQGLSREVILLNEYVDVLTSLERAWSNRAYLLIRLARTREAEEIDVKPRKYNRKNIDNIAMKEMDL
jgi:hypothetical protein